MSVDTHFESCSHINPIDPAEYPQASEPSAEHPPERQSEGADPEAPRRESAHRARTLEVEFGDADVLLRGQLTIPEPVRGLILFAHGSGSSRFSPRNRRIAADLVRQGFATLLFDLLTQEEERADQYTGRFRFDVGPLSRRLVTATAWAIGQIDLRHLGVGYFGGSTGAAAALLAAAEVGGRVQAVVSRGGRPDLAGAALPRVQAATLLIVGGRDEEVLELNRAALLRLRCVKQLAVVPGATHLFEEPGALEEVSRLAGGWFRDHLPSSADAGDRRRFPESLDARRAR